MVEYGFEQKSFQANSVRVLVVSLFLAVVFVWAIALTPEHGGIMPAVFHKELLVDFINVGQGDSILIRTPRGRNFLIDGGMQIPFAQAKKENRELSLNYLRKLGIRKLDGLVVTHFHNDHLGGVVPVLKQTEVAKVWDPGNIFNTQIYKDYIDLCEKKRFLRVITKAGTVLDWGDELFVMALHPTEIGKSEEFSAINNTSITLLIRYGKFSMILAGDIEDDAEKEVARYGKALKSQIMKLPHHGSETSINKNFIDYVSPGIGVILVGRGNPFGHPSPPALNLYNRRGVQLYRSDHHGTIRLSIGGTSEEDFSFQVDRNL